MRAGDVVLHKPTGEEWLLACADNGEVICCGWPETIAKESDCEIIRPASNDLYRHTLESVAKQTGSYRGGIARRQLEDLTQNFIGSGI